MLDFTKITFNELDVTDKPCQVFYGYELDQNGIDDLLRIYADDKDIPEDAIVQNIELCLTFYSRHDCKLEACCTDINNKQYWIELSFRLTNCDEFIEIIPECERIKIKKSL
jgi:hypothetical protein